MWLRWSFGGVCAAVTLALVCTSGCARGRRHELRGQVLAIDAARREVTIKHDDIRGFMPAMTMAFKVRDAALLDGRTPGELVRATLVVDGSDAYLESITSTGRAPLTEAPPRPRTDPLNAGDAVPDVSFVDEAGAARQLAGWRGRAIVVTFIFTRCPLPDFCPLMDTHFAAVQRQVRDDERLRGRVQLLSVSFDPSHDTPAVLAAHAKKNGADPAVWNFVTGDREEIDAFAALFGVSVMREGTNPSDIVHNLRTAVIDGNGRLVKVFNGIQWESADLVAELRSAVGGR